MNPVKSQFPNGECPTCGGRLCGDGYKTVLHCEEADLTQVWETEPDAEPIYCATTNEKETI